MDNKEELQAVDFIASGYEWVCPECEILHKEIEILSIVECYSCRKEYKVLEVHHAYE